MATTAARSRAEPVPDVEDEAAQIIGREVPASWVTSATPPKSRALATSPEAAPSAFS